MIRNNNKSGSSLESLKQKSVTQYRQGRYRESLATTEKAIQLAPGDLSLINNASSLCVMTGDLAGAEKYYRKSLAINPDNTDVLFYLGRMLSDQGRYDESAEVLIKALALRHDFIDARLLLATVYLESDRFSDAENEHLEILSLRPDQAESYYNYALFLKHQHRYDESKSAIRKALLSDPEYADAKHLMGFFYYEEKKFKEAEDTFRSTLNDNPGLVNARWNLSHLLLDLSRFSEGWALYESRLNLNDRLRHSLATIPPSIDVDYYSGESLVDKTLLIWTEQGIGDEVMFASILPELKDKGADIILACDRRMVSLFGRSFPFLKAMAKDPANRYPRLAPSIDYHLGLGSLPGLYRRDIHDFTDKQPYLKADQDVVAKWRSRYGELDHSLNVGISWRGGNSKAGRQDRSVGLIDYLPILEQPANFINLQYGDHGEELSEFTESTGIVIHDWEDSDPLRDLDNFAAQIEALDLVISIDNSTVHFSGALGVRTFVMLPFNQDWRWAEEREDSYWYPGILKLFRQERSGVWEDVIERIAMEFEAEFQAKLGA